MMPIQTIGLQPEYGAAQRDSRVLAVFLDGRGCSLMFLSRSTARHEPGEDLRGLVVAPLRDEITRRLGQREGEDAVDGGGDDTDEEHPAPRRRAEPQRLGCAAGTPREHGVAQQGREDTERDRELLQGGEAHRASASGAISAM